MAPLPLRPENFFDDPDNTDRNLIILAIVGIKDPVRREVPDAVATCKKAGIVVRMVTGEHSTCTCPSRHACMHERMLGGL